MTEPSDSYRLVLQRLQDLERAGVSHLPKCTVSAPPPIVVEPAVVQHAGTQRAASQPPETQRVAASPPTVPIPDPVTTSRATQPDPAAPGIDQPATLPSASSPASPGSIVTAADLVPLAELPNHPLDERTPLLAQLDEQVKQCTSCPELVSNRTQTVFGVGNPQPRLVFFGEGPGADEDRQGEPFVGRAGQLLNKIIGAMSLQREDVYILNAVKCRPPQNRNPKPDELNACRGILDPTT